MKIEKCPKNMSHCSEQCPMFPCWAYEEYMVSKDKEKKQRDEGWE